MFVCCRFPFSVAGYLLLLVLSLFLLYPTPLLAAANQEDSDPHPIFGDVRVRQAFAHCTDKQGLLEKLFPYLEENQKALFTRESFLAPSHWAYDESLPIREFDPVAADELLTQAGWVKVAGSDVRVAQGALYAEDSTELSFELITVDSPTRRQTYSELAFQWLEFCGVDLQTTYLPADAFLGIAPGSIAHRDFEATAFAWTTGVNPPVEQFYGCDSIPAAENGWDGLNFGGYCSPEFEQLLAEAQNLPGAGREERAEFYRQVHEQLYEDSPYLFLYTSPLFYGANANLQNFDPQPIDQALWNIDTWTLPGVNNLVVKSSQEPANLLTDRSPAAQNLAGAIHDRPVVNIDYDTQAHSLAQLPTAANGGVQEQNVDVQAGDLVYNTAGNLVTLAPGVEIQLADGSVIVYQGGTVQMDRLVVNYEFKGDLKWSDGTPITAQDYQFAYDAICSPELGSEAVCNPIDEATFTDSGYTLTFHPGFFLEDFSTPPFTYLPTHQIIQSDGEHQGKRLDAVPFADWLTLPEVTDTPLTTGPFQPTQWIHGQQLVLTANQFYREGPPNFEQVTIRFDMTSQEGYDALVAGIVHVADGIAASNVPSVTVHILPGTTWEHIDFNLELFDQTASRKIAETGGTLTNDLGLTVNVSAGTFDSEVRVIINHLARPTVSLSNIGTPLQIFEVTILDSNGMTLTTTPEPLELTFTYTDTQLGGLADETLNVFHLDGTTWEPQLPCDGCIFKASEKQIVLSVDQLSEFALVGRGELFVPAVANESAQK